MRLDLDFLVVEFAGAQLLAKGIARCGARVGADQGIENTFLRGELCARLNILTLALAGLGDRDLHQIANDLFDVAADIAHFGEFRGLDLDEWRVRELCEPPGDLGLADPGRTDHQDIFRKYLLAH